MKKKNFWIILLVVLIIVGLIITLTKIQNKRDARPFNPSDFPETLVVENSTNYDRADTLCLYLAYRILGLDTINLMITYIPEHLNSGEMEFYGLVQQLPFKTNQFLILLSRKDLSLSKLKETLSHEFVHINQYITGNLVVYPEYAVYRDQYIYFDEVKYKDRLFEREAFYWQGDYYKRLNKFLYD